MEGPTGLNLSEARLFDQVRQRYEPSAEATEVRHDQAKTFRNVSQFSDIWGVTLPYYFLSMAALSLPLYAWSWQWFLSGTPFLIFTLLLGNPGDLFRQPPVLAIIILAVHASYLLCNTSWLLIKMYKAVCFPAILITALVRSVWLQNRLRNLLRSTCGSLQFHGDKLAFFGLPAIDIDDGDVPCLLVIRGVTLTLSTLTFEVHGVEVGVKINDDLEIGIQTDTFIWRVGRSIDIGDIYGSIKGPFSEKSNFHRDFSQNDHQAHKDITNDKAPRPIAHPSAKSFAGESMAKEQYLATLAAIDRNDVTHQARRELAELSDENQMRALIGSAIHGTQSVPNPPKRSVKSSALTKMVPPLLKFAFHKIPVLLRGFLNPVAYNHPVLFKSITCTGRGEYIKQVLEQKLYKHYVEENKELDKLKQEVAAFLSNGKFSLVLDGILGLASVPLQTNFDIVTFIKTPSILVIKCAPPEKSDDETLVDGDNGRQEHAHTVAEINGAAATFTIPSYLLPNHEHLLPEPPAEPQAKDEAQIKMIVLASLPGKFDDSMIGFLLTLIKSSQVLTLHKNANSMSQEVHSFRDFFSSLIGSTSEQIKKGLVEQHVDDAWLEKLLMKVINGLRTLKGDFGYQTDIPVDLKDLRPAHYYVRR